MDWDGALFNKAGNPGLFGYFIQRGGQTASGGIAQHMDFANFTDQFFHHMIKRRAVAGDITHEGKFFPSCHDGKSVISHTAAYQNGVSRAGKRAGRRRLCNKFGRVPPW